MTTLTITKKALATQMGVSRSTLYYKPKQPLKDATTKKEIEAVMKNNRAYGQRRVAIALKMNKKKAGRVMRLFHLRPALRRRSKPYKPDDIGNPAQNKENILKRLCPLHANIVWAGDFTYFWFAGCFWYLATVIDVFTREIIGWHVGNHHTTALIVQAFKDAVKRTEKTPRWFHSDQGSEYVSGVYEALLIGHGVIPSCSKKGSPWQNGFQESFYNNFKLELGKISRFTTVGELIEAIHGQINYYNERRIHLSIKMSPVTFRKLHEQKNVAGATNR